MTRVLSLHLLVWSVIFGRVAANAHVCVAPAADEQATLRSLNSLSRARDGFIASQVEKVALDEPRLHGNAQGRRA